MQISKLAQAISDRGYSVIPTTNNKNPTIEIRDYDSRKDKKIGETFKGAEGIAIRTGKDTKITCIDIDTKYCLDGTLGDDFLNQIPKQLRSKLKINGTKNGGLHIIFTSDYMTGNTVLASRETTDEEVIATFSEALRKGKTFKESVINASQDRQRVLVETRGGSPTSFGGYFLIPPSNGYKAIQNVPIPHLTMDETELLYNIGYSLCKNVKMVRKVRLGKSLEKRADLTAFKKIDGSHILKAYGWEEVGRERTEVRLKRPGNAISKDSAIYNLDTNIFVCFSTSTVFRAGEGYNNVDLLMELENTSDIKDVIPAISKYLTFRSYTKGGI